MWPLFVCPDGQLSLQLQCGSFYIHAEYVHPQIGAAEALPEKCGSFPAKKIMKTCLTSFF